MIATSHPRACPRSLVLAVAILLLFVAVLASPAPSSGSDLSVGQGFACALAQSGQPFCWGANEWGQLGNGTEPPPDHRDESADSSVPTAVVGLPGPATAVTTGWWHSCAIVNGGAWCWGDNSWSQLGGFSGGSSPVPTPVSGMETGVTAISANYFNTCAVKLAKVHCWGSNNYGNLFNGYPGTSGSGTPVEVSGLDGATDVSVSVWHACAIVSGSAKCFGESGGLEYPLGAGPESNSAQINQVTGLTAGITDISRICAVHNSAAKCWAAYLYHGSVGGVPSGLQYATVVPGLESNVSTISVGHSGTLCAVMLEQAHCVGNNDDGRLGNGSSVPFSSQVVPVAGLDNGVSRVSVGGDSACARVGTRVRCWGSNYRGQLGNGTSGHSSVPVDVDFGAPDTPAPTPTPTPWAPLPELRCHSIALVGVRGTTEKQSSHSGFGTTLNEFRKTFRRGLTQWLGDGMREVGLRYPAAPRSIWDASLTESHWDRYKASAKSGRAALRRVIENGSDRECFVLVGYSQGAHVVGDVLADRSLLGNAQRRKIVAVVLIADTRFDPKDTTVHRQGSFDKSEGGWFQFFGRRKRGSLAATDTGVRYRVVTYCNRYDFFCQAGATPNVDHAMRVHGGYSSAARKLGSDAARFVSSELNP